MMGWLYGKRGVVALLAIFFAFSALPIAAQTVRAMPAADFEDDTLQGFAGRGGMETLEVSGDVAHSGVKSLRVSGREQAWHGPSLNVTQYIEEGLEYRITVWVHAGIPEASNFKLSTQVGQGDAASYANVDAKIVNVSDGWVQMSGKYRYTNTSGSYITVYVENDDKNAAFYIDDLEVAIIDGEARADVTLPALKEKYGGMFLIGNVISPQDTKGIRFDTISKQTHRQRRRDVIE